MKRTHLFDHFTSPIISSMDTCQRSAWHCEVFAKLATPGMREQSAHPRPSASYAIEAADHVGALSYRTGRGVQPLQEYLTKAPYPDVVAAPTPRSPDHSDAASSASNNKTVASRSAP